jgi:hypothetical protein
MNYKGTLSTQSNLKKVICNGCSNDFVLIIDKNNYLLVKNNGYCSRCRAAFGLNPSNVAGAEENQ